AAISVPPWSALHPPRDGTTSPPAARSCAMSERYRPSATVWLRLPFHASVHDVLLSVSRKASVKYLAPDAFDVDVMPSDVHVSKYGANTWFGSGVAAAAEDGPDTVNAISIREASWIERLRRACVRRRMSVLLCGSRTPGRRPLREIEAGSIDIGGDAASLHLACAARPLSCASMDASTLRDAMAAHFPTARQNLER